MEPAVLSPSDTFVAVLYSFESVVGGERRSIAQEDLPASRMAMLEPQLAAAPKRSMVDYGSGLLVYDEYQDARFAASTIVSVASRVELCEVVAGSERGAGWRGESGAWFVAVAGGLREVVTVDARG